jgi:hypothetical protein
MGWQERCEQAGGTKRGPAQPQWLRLVPLCSEACQYHDGKRCQLLGFIPGLMCEPVVAAMAAELEAKS